MGNDNCCNSKPTQQQLPDIENLKFEGLDYNKSQTYKELEQIALEVAQQKGIPLYYNGLICRVIAHRQEHLLKKLNDLATAEDRQRMLQSMENIEFEMLDSLYYNYCIGESKRRKKSYLQEEFYEPFIADEPTDEFINDGLDLIRNKGVALCLLMGGSCERFKRNKSIIDLGLPSGKSIVCLLMQRIIRLQKMAQIQTADRVPVYVVCNEENFYEVKQHFSENKFFGIAPTLFQFYVQQNIPILDEDGHIVLKASGTPISRPGGAGTIMSTFLQNNFLNKAVNANIKYIHFVGVENLLCLPLDPEMIGMANQIHADVTTKVIHQEEGTDLPFAVQINGRFKVMDDLKNLEEIPVDTGLECDQVMNDVLVSVPFLQRLQKDQLLRNQHHQKYHVVRRLIDGRYVTIFEKYIQDLAELTENLLVLKVHRLREYAPVNYDSVSIIEHEKKGSMSSSTSSKSKKQIFEGADESVTRTSVISKKDMSTLQLPGEKINALQQLSLVHKQWLKLRFPSQGFELLEISPLLSYRGEELQHLAHMAVKRFKFPMYVE